MSERFEFLSGDWIDAANRIFDRRGAVAPRSLKTRINLTVTGAPFASVLRCHIIVRRGRLEWGADHTRRPNAVLSMDYDTARRTLLQREFDAAIDATFSGEIKLAGDAEKVRAFHDLLVASPDLLDELAGVSA